MIQFYRKIRRFAVVGGGPQVFSLGVKHPHPWIPAFAGMTTDGAYRRIVTKSEQFRRALADRLGLSVVAGPEIPALWSRPRLAGIPGG